MAIRKLIVHRARQVAAQSLIEDIGGTVTSCHWPDNEPENMVIIFSHPNMPEGRDPLFHMQSPAQWTPPSNGRVGCIITNAIVDLLTMQELLGQQSAGKS